MKCAFNQCEQKWLSLPLTLSDRATEKTFHFCNMAHLFGWMLIGMGQSVEGVMQKAALAAKSPMGRKAVVSYLVEKFL